MKIAESDWKKFKQIRALALERFSQQVLDDCARIYADESLTAHERYLELYRLFQDRDREMAKTFNDLRRSTTALCLMLMWRQRLVTEDELATFSSEVQRMARFE